MEGGRRISNVQPGFDLGHYGFIYDGEKGFRTQAYLG